MRQGCQTRFYGPWCGMDKKAHRCSGCTRIASGITNGDSANIGARDGSAAMDQREAFRSPLEQASDPGSGLAAVVLVGIVDAGATASSRQKAPPVSFGMRSAVNLGIGIGHAPSRT